MSISLDSNFFEVFNLPLAYELKQQDLEKLYLDLQTQVHPDRFANQSDSLKRLAVQWAAKVNEAYQTLKDPLRRAQYLLKLQGIDVKEETSQALPVEFLMEQMQWREQIQEAQQEQNTQSLEALLAQINEQMVNLQQQISQQFAEKKDSETIALNIKKWMFFNKIAK